MKIGQKITLGYLGVALLVGIAGYFAVRTSEESLASSIGNSSAFFAQAALNSIDREIYKWVEELVIGTVHFMMRADLVESNQQYSMMPDPQAYILEKDREWAAAPKETVTPFMRQLIDARLSGALREKIEFYQQKNGHKVLGEIFITNTYGANIAQSGKTSDFRQDDEEWWRLAVANGIYVGDVEYDESAGINSLDLAVRVDGKNGGFLGVVKGVLNIEEVEAFVQGIKKQSGYKTSEITVLSKNHDLIYSTSRFNQTGPEYWNMLNFGKDKPYGVRMVPGRGEKLLAYASSQGYKDFAGLGWSLVIEHDTDEILTPVIRLRDPLLAILLAGIMLSVLAGSLFTRSLALTLQKLSDGVQKIMRGDLQAKIDITSDDEIGDFARSFDTMTADLRRRGEELMAEKAYSDSVLRAVGESVIVIDAQGTIEVFNETAEQVFGYAAGEVIGKNVRELMPVAYREKHSQGMRNYHETGKGRVIGTGHLEFEGLHSSGRVFPIDLTVSEMTVPGGGRKVFIGIIRDISIPKQIRDQVASTAKFPDQSPNPVLRISKDGDILYANKSSHPLLKAWDRTTGQKLGEYWHKTVQEILAGKKIREMEVSAGEAEYSLTFVPVAESEYVNIYGYDITERKKTRRRLEESEARVSAIVKAAIDGIITVDDQGTVQMFNPAAGEIFGYDPADVVGRHVRMLLPAALGKEQFQQYISSYVKAGKSKVFGSSQRVSAQRKDGRAIGLDLSLSETVTSSGRRLFIGIFRQADERAGC